jgi:hypothetical protein
VAFFFKTGGYFGEELWDIFRNSLDKFDGGENGFLSDVGRGVADALNEVEVTFKTS